MDKLENVLSTYKNENHQFSDDFTAKMMRKIEVEKNHESTPFVQKKLHVWWAAAACVAMVFISIYIGDGSVSVDSLLGLSQYSQSEIGQSVETYSHWDLNR